MVFGHAKTLIVTKLKERNCDKIQKRISWQNSKTQIVTKLKKSNGDKTQKTQIVIVVIVIVVDRRKPGKSNESV